jgi:hypothetical protein
MTFSRLLVVSALLLLSSIVFPFVDMPFYWLYFRDAAEQLREVIKLHLGNTTDPLLDVVGVLELN